MGLIAQHRTAGYNRAVIILELITTMSAGLFSGASIYVNLVEHPARMGYGTASAIAQWIPSYKRATVMQATLAAVGFLSATCAWLLGGGAVWLLGGVLLGLVIPFTLIVVLPTNRRLLSPNLDKESPEARQLMNRWSRLHAVRSLLSFSAFLVFLVSLSRSFH
jgi:anthrone oxygenase-like protein